MEFIFALVQNELFPVLDGKWVEATVLRVFKDSIGFSFKKRNTKCHTESRNNNFINISTTLHA